jgi:hypothetical protein
VTIQKTNRVSHAVPGQAALKRDHSDS